ncbi:DUF885 domain-containing protein [Arsenicicoccus dermatophilus]|uniref:DUF885 domain-containing protein n=1 Tax=Arsenicicoccus dermatophilus TaxID=1076331 RepID=UPI0039170226
MSNPRIASPTAVDRLAEEFVRESLALSPLLATYMGVGGHDDEIDDFSPDGLRRRSELRTRTLAALAAVEPRTDADRVTVAAMTERLQLQEEVYAAGLEEASLNVIGSPLQDIRAVFDVMPHHSVEEWATIALRMARVPLALEQYQESLLTAREKGNVSSRRQVEACVRQCRDLVAPDGYFDGFLRGALAPTVPLPAELRERLHNEVGAARAAYARMADFLRDELLDDAPEQDAVGRSVYELCSRLFLGATVDLEETYRWGQEELARITAQMQEVAEQISPGATVAEAIAVLDADPAYTLHGTDALREWMQGKAEEVMTMLDGRHFDIPDPVRRIECCIAPTQTGGIYYTAPSDDFSRPGRMWWSVPKGVTSFSTWRELTTVYHEGVPGHHLQLGQAVANREQLNSWRRQLCWTSGHGEGWALYAERLMADFGYLDDPGNRLGWLDGQSLRAARVVLDIGVHCGFEAPAEVGGGDWTYDKAWAFLDAHAAMDEAFLRFELDRYLGWPGQAPAYKIGERLWLQLRDEVQQREGESFSLKDFHRRALDLGGLPLDVLRDAVLGTL